jgi:hypothetical protein
MSNSDANYYNNEIDRIHRDNKRMSELFSNQTHILNLYMQRTEGIIQDYVKKFQRLTPILKA